MKQHIIRHITNPNISTRVVRLIGIIGCFCYDDIFLGQILYSKIPIYSIFWGKIRVAVVLCLRNEVSYFVCYMCYQFISQK